MKSIDAKALAFALIGTAIFYGAVYFIVTYPAR